MSKPKEPLQVPYAEWRCRRDYLTYVNNCKPGEPSEQYLWDEQSGWQKVPCKWEPATEFTDTLILRGTERGRSAARLVLESATNGNRYQMFFADFVDMVKQIDMHKGIFVGRFIPCKKGSNYAIRWVGGPNE